MYLYSSLFILGIYNLVKRVMAEKEWGKYI